MNHAQENESISRYRSLAMIYATNLWHEKNPENRANIAMYLAEVATTLARMEAEEARKFKEASVS
ncbi:MAG: hypothetical protein EBE86_028370 [Hormoscilla sp. GUM202]|nr:hypothetical protein [Hormoscilla sp. GM7CHS1pb]MBO1351033.1 hypothetical protein [Hormoscilla sp. GUM202]